MLNYHQRGEVLAHSLGLLDAKVLVAETDLVSAVTESGSTASAATLTIGIWSGSPPARPPPTRIRWPLYHNNALTVALASVITSGATAGTG